MFYASCPTACPLLIGDVLALEEALPPGVKEDTRVLLVSLDPARDTPEKMAQVVSDRSLDTDRWTLSRAELADVRVVAAALSVSYRALDDGEMNHSSILTVLDRDGVPVQQLEGLRQDPAPLVAALSGL
jgi:protein SCO1/2